MRILRIAVVLALLSIIGCGGPPPDAEVQAAEQALQSAQQAGADVYSQEGFQEAQQSLEAARQEIAVQQEKTFGVDYTNALELLETAKSKAEEAAAGVEERKEELRAQAQQAEQEASEAIEQANEALRRAPRRGKGARADIAALTRDLDGAKSTLAQAQGELSNDDLIAALDHFKEAKAQAERLISNIPSRR